MSRKLPERPNLEFLRKQAKQLLKSVREGDSYAVSRVKSALPFWESGLAGFRLHDAQSVVAREFGFESWDKLKSHIEALQLSNVSQQEIADAFLRSVAKGRLNQAEALLRQNPWLPGFSIHTAAVIGERNQVAEFLSDAPQSVLMVSEVGYPYTPLAYCCISPFGRKKENHSRFYEAAQLLLQYGASPDETFINDDYPNDPLSVLYAASGLNNNPVLMRLLLEAGASPNDNESLYHSAEHSDHECMKLLFEFGVNRATAYDVAHSLDHDDLEGLRLLLEHGADIDHPDMSVLHHAILRRRSLEHFKLLVAYGADPNRKHHLQSVFQCAVSHGRLDITSLLEKLEVPDDSSPEDRFAGACCSGDIRTARAILQDHPGLIEGLSSYHLGAFSEAVFEGDDKAIATMLEVGFPVNAVAKHFGAPLHSACWLGRADLVKRFLDAGADINCVDPDHKSTPFGWVCHGSNNAMDALGNLRNPTADYGKCAELLIEAGAAIPQDINASEEVVEAINRLQKI